MKTSHKIIIFGAGANGEKLMKCLGEENVTLFCDNHKAGMILHGKKVIDFLKLQDINRDGVYDIILSTNSDEIRKQMENAGISYWEASGIENNFFLQEAMRKALDEEVLDRYLSMQYYDGKQSKDKNWFRTDFISDKNQQLVLAMKKRDRETVSDILADVYDKGIGGQKLYADEYYINRPGMRLIAHLIRQDRREKIEVCDLACGHGAFLKELKSDRIVCCGADTSSERCRSLQDLGIECRQGDLEDSGYGNKRFDYVTMMECLEHVADPFAAMKEAYRILKDGGKIFVTVPYGTDCESDMHVRLFYENDLYSVATRCNYTEIKIMRLPYMNSSYHDNLFMTAKKS